MGIISNESSGIMPKRTSKYNLGYYQKDDITSAELEMQRWETIDAQLSGLFSIIGNGVISGWTISNEGGLNISISSGKAHISYLAVETNEIKNLQNLTPSTRNYIYAQLTTDSAWNKKVNFVAYVNDTAKEQSLFIGYVDTNSTGITSINTTDRQDIGFVNLIKETVKSHRHIGGENNPAPINLSSEVQGKLSSENIDDLDASKVVTGVFGINRIPKLSHDDNISDKGSLTHNQIESLLEQLSVSKSMSMGETALTNLLQLVLALKHSLPNIDDYLINQFAIIPGISPDSYLDLENSTAVVDTRVASEGGEHTITGEVSQTTESFTKKWNKASEHEDSNFENTKLYGDKISLTTTNNSVPLDDFDNLNNWTIITQDSSSVTSNVTLDNSIFVNADTSGKITINGQEIEIILTVKKTFAIQDWSNYKYIKFNIFTESVEHGDILFYIKDNTHGIQNSYYTAIARNRASINNSTLDNGWEEVIYNISDFSRNSIIEVGFLVSSSSGWNPAKSFNFNIDAFSLNSGNKFVESGHTRLIFGNNYMHYFDTIRWDAILPAGTSVQTRARFADTEFNLSSANWTELSSDSENQLSLEQDDLYKYIEIEIYLSASSDLLNAPTISSIELSYSINGDSNSISIDSQEDWENGNLFNIDTISSPGSIKISNTDDIGTFIYAGENKAKITDANFNQLKNIIGSSLPKTTNQILNGEVSKFGLITSIDRGSNGTIWIADIDNDRIVNIDSAGNLISGIYGSFLEEPENNYGIEENGPGSNVYENETFVNDFDKANKIKNSDELKVLHSLLNTNTGELFIVFNKNVENIYDSETFDVSKINIKIGNNIIYIGDGECSLLGIDEVKYLLWKDLYSNSTNGMFEYNSHLRQFKFLSHVLVVNLKSSENSAAITLLEPTSPRVSINYPYVNSNVSSSFSLDLNIKNANIKSDGSADRIKLYIDNALIGTYYSGRIAINDLANGEHEIKCVICNSSGVAYSNSDATATSVFFVQLTTSNALLGVLSPLPNQTFSGNKAVIQFELKNLSATPSGNRIKYNIDTNGYEYCYDSQEIEISDLSAGMHTLYFQYENDNGELIDENHTKSEIKFYVCETSQLVTLFIKENTIKSFDGIFNIRQSVNIDVANIKFGNIYSPNEVRYENKTNSIVIGKLRSPSYLSNLSDETYATEMANRMFNASLVAAKSKTNPKSLNSNLANIKTKDLIFGNKFMDGHSVVELDENYNVILSNNSATFANSKEECKEILGGVKKVGLYEFLISDSIKNRAIIVNVDDENKTSKVTWEYISDKYIVDSAMEENNIIDITINNGNINPENVFVKQFQTVRWINNSSTPITIYSGYTTSEMFSEDSDLTKYGEDFQSESIGLGETYLFQFSQLGTFYWFVNPGILTGKIECTEYRFNDSDNIYILESDNIESPFASQIRKINKNGETLWAFGNGYLVKPRDIRIEANGKITIST